MAVAVMVVSGCAVRGWYGAVVSGCSGQWLWAVAVVSGGWWLAMAMENLPVCLCPRRQMAAYSAAQPAQATVGGRQV